MGREALAADEHEEADVRHGEDVSKGPRRHHYVPQFLLKQFVNGSDGRLRQLDKTQGRISKCSPADACVIKDLYRLEDAGSRDVPEAMLSQVEGAAARVMHDILASRQEPPGQGRRDFAGFLWLMHHRGPLGQGQAEAMGNVLLKMTMETLLEHEDVFRAALEETDRTMNQDESETMRVEALRMFRSGEIRARMNDDLPVVTLFDNLGRGASLVEQLGWRLMIAPPDARFVLSDTPLTILEPNPTDNGRGVGLASSPQVETALPLDPTACLTLCPSYPPWTVTQATRDQVEHINLRTYEWAGCWIYAPTQQELQELQQTAKEQRTQRGRMAYRPPTFELRNVTEDGTLLGTPECQQIPATRRLRRKPIDTP